MFSNNSAISSLLTGTLITLIYNLLNSFDNPHPPIIIANRGIKLTYTGT